MAINEVENIEANECKIDTRKNSGYKAAKVKFHRLTVPEDEKLGV